MWGGIRAHSPVGANNPLIALKPRAVGEIMDEAAVGDLIPVTSSDLPDSAGRGSDPRMRGLAAAQQDEGMKMTQEDD